MAGAKESSPVGGIVAALVCVALGIGFRLTNLDRKYFWFDEVHSAACVSGRAVQEVDDRIDERPHRLIDLREYLHLRPGEPMSTTITALLDGNPENAPLYFALLRGWAELFGDDAARLRLLSAVASILCLPLLFWFCRELFESSRTAWTAIAWWSLSPFFVLYAQEARTYSVLAMWIILAGAALARAVRTGSAWAWVLYAIAIALGLYTHMFMGTLLIAHVAYIAIYGHRELGGEWRRRLWNRFSLAATAGVLAFVPWFVLFLRHARHHELSAFLTELVGPHQLIAAGIENVGAAFVDLGPAGFSGSRLVGIAIALPVVWLVWRSLRYLIATAPRRSSLLVASTALTPPLLFLVTDLVFFDGRSQVARYWIAAYVGMGIAVSYFLATKLAERVPGAGRWVALLVVLAVASNVRASLQTSWWNKGAVIGQLDFFLLEDRLLREKLAEIAAAPRPLLVVEYDYHKSFELPAMSTLADPKIEWLGVRDLEAFDPPTDYDLFVFRSPRLVEQLEAKGYEFTVLEYSKKFQRLERRLPSHPRRD